FGVALVAAAVVLLEPPEPEAWPPQPASVSEISASASGALEIMGPSSAARSRERGTAPQVEVEQRLPVKRRRIVSASAGLDLRRIRSLNPRRPPGARAAAAGRGAPRRAA